MEEIYQKKEKLKLHEIKQGIILPRKLTEDGPSWGLGGVCDRDNQFVEQSFYDGGWAKHGGYYPWDNEQTVDKEVVYIGLFVKHWGHFLIDCTSKLWGILRLLQENRKFIVGYIGEEKIEGNYLEFFELLGIKREQLLHIQVPTRCQNVILPEASFRPCIWYTREFQGMFDTVVQNALQQEYDNKEYCHVTNVYFTRRNFQKAQSTEFGEGYIESCFLDNGFTAIAPEELSLSQQIYVWNQAESIVCMNGTIPLNVCFCQNSNLKLIVLNKMSIFHKNPYILLFMRNIEATFIDVYKEPFKNYPKSLGEGPYLIRASKAFDDFCSTEGLKMPMSMKERRRYERIEALRYYWRICNIKGRIRGVIARIIHR